MKHRHHLLLAPAIILMALVLWNFSHQNNLTNTSSNEVVSRPQELLHREILKHQAISKISRSENTGVHFSEFTRSIVHQVRQGKPLLLSLPDRELKFQFRPQRVTTENFGISLGLNDELPSSFSVFNGQEISNLVSSKGQTSPASLAVVNGALALNFEIDGREYSVFYDPRLTQNYAEPALEFAHCTKGPQGLRQLHAPKDPPSLNERIPVGLSAQEDELEELMDSKEVWPDHDGYALGPKYNNTLKDLNILVVINQEVTTDDPETWPKKAAAALLNSAKAHLAAQRHLGLRYLLSEIILVPDLPEFDDLDPAPTNDPFKNITHFSDWMGEHRPQDEYPYGHAMCMSEPKGGFYGLAYDNNYGNEGSNCSLSILHGGKDTQLHELSHNMGAGHSVTGVMYPSVNNSPPTFLAISYYGTGKIMSQQIYSFMTRPERTHIYGPAKLRAPLEMPFANHDFAQTPENTPVLIEVLENDDPAVIVFTEWDESEARGAHNKLNLVEIGTVYPRDAGTTEIVDRQVRFSPTPGFTGVAWFTYSIVGSIGNGGAGWMHSADITIQVGDDDSPPEKRPLVEVHDDHYQSPLLEPFRFNPLLNDIAPGMTWGGPVDSTLGPSGDTPVNASDAFNRSYSYFLVNAEIIEGQGSLEIETRNAVYNGVSETYNSGALTYTPAVGDPPVVTIRYLASDDLGNQGTGTITITRAPALQLFSNTLKLYELGESRGTVTFHRTEPADLSTAAQIKFELLNDLSWNGRPSDLTLSGASSFDPATGMGTIEIPAGSSSTDLHLQAHHDGLEEGSEQLTFVVQDAGNLLPPPPLTLTISEHDNIPLPSLDSLWLPMNQSAGNKILEVNGTVAGTMTGTAVWSLGPFGNALSFDGETTFLEIKEAYLPPLESASRTVTAWIKTPGAEDASMHLVTYGTGNEGRRFWFGISSEGLLRMGAGGGQAIATTPVTDDQWHFVACVVDDDGSPNTNELRFYLNGNPDPISNESDRILATSSTPVFIGARPDETSLFKGLLDEVRIFPRALTEEEILSLYENSNMQPALAWHQYTFGSENADWTADPDGDSLNLFQEYLFGGNPFYPDPGAATPNFQRDGTNWVFSWNQRLTGTHSFRYLPESSSNLTDWSTLPLLPTTQPHPNNPGEFETQSIEIPSNPKSQNFFRIRVENTTTNNNDE